MWIVVIFGALAAAFLNAVGSVVQRRATGQVDIKRLFRHRLLVDAFTNRKWLLGGLATLGAFGFQALALSHGSLVVVEPLLTTDLVFLMLMLHIYFKVGIGRREWAGAVFVSGGLSVLLASANPQGGNIPYRPLPWIILIAIVVAMIFIAAFVVRRGPEPRWRAAISGVSAGGHFALTVALVKLCVQQLQYGFVHELASWPLWMLAVVGSTSLISLQSMYGAGPLAISWPIAEITEALAGATIGLVIFGDHINSTPAAIVAETAGLVVLVTGIALLAGSSRLRNSQEV